MLAINDILRLERVHCRKCLGGGDWLSRWRPGWRPGRLFCCIRREARLLGGVGRPAAAAARKGKAG